MATPKPPRGRSQTKPASKAKPGAVPAQPRANQNVPVDGQITRAIAGNNATNQRTSIEWFHSMIKGQIDARGRARSSARRIPEAAFGVKKGLPVLGQMFFYIYDAKYKDELPFWDKFPIVIPIKYYSNGWLGLNLHYIPPGLRGPLLDKLMEYTKAANSPRAFMKLSYPLLKSIVRTKTLAPLIHRYLASHVKTDLVRVEPEYWMRAALLPVQQFQKESATTVWRQSR